MTREIADITRQPISLAVLLSLLGASMGVLGMAWQGASHLATMQAEITHLAKGAAETDRAWRDGIEAAKALGREQREQIARRSMEMNQHQQAALDQMRLEQGQTAAFVAEAKERMRGMEAALSRIEAAQQARPVSAPVGPVERAVPAWSATRR